MPAVKAILVDKRRTTYNAIATELKITRQAAKAKYDRIKSIYGVVTWEYLRMARHQSPEVAARKAENQVSYYQQRVVTHALLHGLTSASITFEMTKPKIQKLVDAATKRVK